MYSCYSFHAGPLLDAEALFLAKPKNGGGFLELLQVNYFFIPLLTPVLGYILFTKYQDAEKEKQRAQMMEAQRRQREAARAARAEEAISSEGDKAKP